MTETVIRMYTETEGTDPGTAPADPGAVTGPHDGLDEYGRLDHRYWRCERCGLESTDASLAEGCWRCGAGGGVDA